jgi:glycosyltransferase involved in cell wall biosynthesis
MSNKKILYLVADDRYFCSHRLPLALKAQQQGYQVSVATPAKGDHLEIQKAGLEFYPISFDRGGLNPWCELKTLVQIFKLYHQLRPDIVHLVALKPVLYGTLVALFAGVPRIIAAVAGLGAIFSQKHWLQKPVKLTLRWLLRWPRVRVIVQNPEDAEVIQSLDPRVQVHLILGAGVDTSVFFPVSEPAEPVTVVHVSRLLWTKGVGEFVAAARLLKEQGHTLRFRLVGEPDLENPDAIPVSVLQRWHKEGIVEWLGYQKDIPKLYQQSHIAVMASYYREGIPKSLIEAAACGKPIITCDMPGCRIIVKDGVNGYLVPPKDSEALAAKILDLALNSDRRLAFGKASRDFVMQHFNQDLVCQQTLELYPAHS